MWQHEIYVQKNDKRYCHFFFLLWRSDRRLDHQPGLAPRRLLVRDSIECTCVQTFAPLNTTYCRASFTNDSPPYSTPSVKVDIVAVVSATWFALCYLHSDRQKLETTLVCPLLSGSAAHLLTRFVTYSYQFIKPPCQYTNICLFLWMCWGFWH